MAIPLIVNVWACFAILFRNPDDGKPIIVKEISLLKKAILTHFGIEFKGDQLGDPDYP